MAAAYTNRIMAHTCFDAHITASYDNNDSLFTMGDL